MLKNILFVGLGSFAGGSLRYLVTRATENSIFFSFPLGTFLVNIIGCLLIGLFYGLFDAGNIINPHLRLFLTVGLCGGFTTFSTFMADNAFLIKDHNYIVCAAYAAISLFVGICFVYLGNYIVKLF
ncbi:MAG: fluoride efflux transporter CrcB [Bacteroidales bacterium]